MEGQRKEECSPERPIDVNKLVRETSPLMVARALGFGVSMGVNNFLSTLRMEMTFLYFLWAIALYLVFKVIKSILVEFKYFMSAFPREVTLMLEWAGSVQEVIHTFIMTNLGFWLTSVYEDASRPKPTSYIIVFVALVGILIHESKYATKSFFNIRPA